jgi:hypothetical protein
MRTPFAITVGEKISHFCKAKEFLTELSCDTSLKIKFEALSVPEFWIFIKKKHVKLSQLSTEMLLLCGTTYLFENNIFSNAAN